MNFKRSCAIWLARNGMTSMMQGTGKKVGDWIVKDRWGTGETNTSNENKRSSNQRSAMKRDLVGVIQPRVSASDLRSPRCPRLLTLIVNFSPDHFNFTLFEQAEKRSLSRVHCDLSTCRIFRQSVESHNVHRSRLLRYNHQFVVPARSKVGH